MSSNADRQLAHIVFFSLHDRGDEARRKLVASCRDHLTGHEGVVHLSFGEHADGFDRPVNDHDFDVALHVVFESKAAHDAYQQSPRHEAFIAENKPSWRAVRVFDSYLG